MAKESKGKRGFAAMSKQKQRAIARKGGQASGGSGNSQASVGSQG